MKYLSAVVLALILTFGTTDLVQGQAVTDDYVEPGWEVNANSGVLFINNQLIGPDDEELLTPEGTFEEDLEATYGFGAQVIRYFDNGVGLGGQFTWSPTWDDNANLFLYSAEASFTVPIVEQLSVVTVAGVGAATTTFDEGIDEEFIDADGTNGDALAQLERENDTNLYVPVSFGLRWDVTDDIALTTKARDDILFNVENPVSAAEGLQDENEVLSNLQFTAGLSLII